jgi:hypothetical protein
MAPLLAKRWNETLSHLLKQIPASRSTHDQRPVPENSQSSSECGQCCPIIPSRKRREPGSLVGPLISCLFGTVVIGLGLAAVGCGSGQGVLVKVASNTTTLGQNITFDPIPSGTVGMQLTLAATSTSGLAVSFSSTTSTVCVVSASSATLLAVGKCTIQASQAGSSAYSPAPSVSQSFNVAEAVAPPAPSLAYTTNPAVYSVGIPIAINSPSGPVDTGSSFSASPALPAGITLNATTGVISGTPTSILPAAIYTVTETDPVRSTAVSLSITVNFEIAMPADYGFSVPSPEPAMPSTFDSFTPPLYTANPLAPAIAEWTRSAGPGNAIELSVAALTADTTFAVYGQNAEAITTPVSVTPAVLDFTSKGSMSGQIASLLLPSISSGVPPGMYLAWPQNNIGKGAPVAINRTEAWWVGPDSATEGDTVSVFGQNLTYPGTYSSGGKPPLVYLVSTSNDSKTYLPPVSESNPYRIEFSTGGINPGNYDVWVHNGAGGSFGWSGPLSLTVSANSPWNCQSSGNSAFSVKAFGAIGNGTADDTTAIATTISTAGIYASNAGHPYATIYFPPGIYMVSTGFQPPSNVCFMGAGTSNWQKQMGNTGSASILRLSRTTVTSGPLSLPQTSRAFIWANEGGGGSNNVEFTGMVLDANGNIPSVWSSPGVYDTLGAQVRFRSSKNVKFDNIVLNGAGPTIYGTGFESFDLLGGVNYYLTNSTIIGTGIANQCTRQVFVSGNQFLAADNSRMMTVNSSSLQIDISKNTQEDLQYFNSINPSEPIPYSYGSGSYTLAIAGQSFIGTGLGPYGLGRIGGSEGNVRQLYIGQNHNLNAGPCDPNNTSGTYPSSYPGCDPRTDSNSGEQVLFETDRVDYGGLATESTATTVSVSGLDEISCGNTPPTNCIGQDAVIVGGTGLGQIRHIIAQDGSRITMSEPWIVNPDATSVIYISNVTYQVAVYDNVEQGKADQASRYTALAGVETYSNVFSLVYDSNQVSNVRTGIVAMTLQTSRPNHNLIVPNYFNLFTNNTITSAIVGAFIADAFYGHSGDPQAVAFVGNTFRNNIFGSSESGSSANTGIYQYGVVFGPSAASVGRGNAIQGVILDGNSFVINPYSTVAAYHPNYPPAGLWTDKGDALIIDTLLNNNSFSLVTGSPSGATGPSYGWVFGSDGNLLPAAATAGDTCVETGTNSITGFATSAVGLNCR